MNVLNRSLFDELFRDADRALRQARVFQPAADLAEVDGGYRVRLELPGVPRGQVSVELANRVLTVSGRKEAPAAKEGAWKYSEAFYGDFRRSFQLPETVDTDSVEARHEDGVLEIALKLRPEIGPRRVEVR